jgi:hypothetical protein
LIAAKTGEEWDADTEPARPPRASRYAAFFYESH